MSERFTTRSSTDQLRRTAAERKPEHFARLALRMRSLSARDALALAASDGMLDDVQMLRSAASRTLPRATVTAYGGRRLAALALAWAGMQRSEQEVAAAAAAYASIWDTVGGGSLGAHHHRVAAQSLYLSRRTEELRRLLPHMASLADDAREFLETDLANPYRAGASATAAEHDVAPSAAWLGLLSRPFTRHGLEPVVLEPARHARRAHPFDRLACPAVEPGTEDGPLVSVVMPCYRPDEGLLTSVASILHQSYGAFEILLVDDASGRDYDELFTEAAALDPRIRLIRRASNGGPYLARNEAIAQAQGELITFQDADDWSHPSRFSKQVGLLSENPQAPACHTRAVRAHDDLTHQWLGYPAMRLHASSLMVRRSVSEEMGDFLPVRKGGDSEYAERVEARVGPVPTIEQPLALYRLRSGSLSRADFTFQWTSPERLAFVGVYRAGLRRAGSAPLPVPLRFAARPVAGSAACQRLDVVYLGDFSRDPDDDPALRAALAMDRPTPGEPTEPARDPAHHASFVPRALWHLETPWAPSAKRHAMHPGWYDRVLDHSWRVVTRLEPVHIERLVVLDPSVLLLCDELECTVTADRVQVVVPAGNDLERDIAAPTVELADVRAVVRRWFGVEPEWT